MTIFASALDNIKRAGRVSTVSIDPAERITGS
jgi:hypothetical protein